MKFGAFQSYLGIPQTILMHKLLPVSPKTLVKLLNREISAPLSLFVIIGFLLVQVQNVLLNVEKAAGEGRRRTARPVSEHYALGDNTCCFQ